MPRLPLRSSVERSARRPMLRWYLVHTKPSAESVAQRNLERQGYEVYLPRLLQRVLAGRQVRERIVSLFPRYLFLRLCEGAQALAPVRSSIGVSGIVRFGGDYAVVPEKVVRDIRSRADPQTGLHRLALRAPLTAGTAVRLMMSPFSGLEGVFDREDGTQRSIVLLKLLGHEIPVRVSAAYILPRDSAWAEPRGRCSAW
jgi:transcriptional antiterminator RfaH